MKKLFKINFLNSDKSQLSIYASKVNPSSFLGLIEVEDIVFMNSSALLVTPEDDKAKIEFKDVERTYIPLNSIIRIDEINVEPQTTVVRLYKDNEDNENN